MSQMQVQRLEAQLAVQHAYQDASHVMVQRAAQIEVDLDQTAAMLCGEMQENANLDASLHQVKGHLAWERERGQLAMAAVRILDAELRQKAYDHDTANHELFITKAKLEHANHILAEAPGATQTAVETKLNKATAQQAKHEGLITTSVTEPAMKLARHNSTPLPTSM